jgi:hypothetical protein
LGAARNKYALVPRFSQIMWLCGSFAVCVAFPVVRGFGSVNGLTKVRLFFVLLEGGRACIGLLGLHYWVA